MKKLILMTSALTLIGGAAAAEITVTAEAEVVYGNWETDGGSATFEFSTEATLAMEETTGALTYGAEITLENGETVAHGVIFVSGGFGKVAFGVDEFGELNDDVSVNAVTGADEDEDYGDVKFDGEFGGVSVTVVADADLGFTPGGTAAGGDIPAGAPDWVVLLGYDAGAVSLGLEADSTDFAELTANFDAGSFNFGASANTDDEWEVSVGTDLGGVGIEISHDDAGVTGLALSGDAGDVAWAVETNTDDETTASIDYTMGDMSIGLAYDNDAAPIADVGDEADLILTVGYGMDMLDFSIMINDANEYEVAMTAGFEF